MENNLKVVGGLRNLPLAENSKFRMLYTEKGSRNWQNAPKIPISSINELISVSKIDSGIDNLVVEKHLYKDLSEKTFIKWK